MRSPRVALQSVATFLFLAELLSLLAFPELFPGFGFVTPFFDLKHSASRLSARKARNCLSHRKNCSLRSPP